MNGEWMKRPSWKVSHFIREDKRTRSEGLEIGWAACGSRVCIDAALELDLKAKRCYRCERRLAGRHWFTGGGRS